jgi:AbrB family looped-hinge helix DNA binding protein
MTVVTLSSKFQVSVPKEVREALKLKAGQKMVFINTGSAIKLLAQPSMADLAGVARGASTAGVRERDEHRDKSLPTVAKRAVRKSSSGRR